MEEEVVVAAATARTANTSPTARLQLGRRDTRYHQHDFKWTHERCLLLLHEYDLLKDKFKDRKHKKKDLWAEISMKFKKIYAYDLEWDVAYKKFRNLKQTFEQVRAKLQQQAITGQISNRPKWAYFEKFQKILDDPGIQAYSYTDPPTAHLHHEQEQQQEQQEEQEHHHHHNQRHEYHIHQHHHHHQPDHQGHHVAHPHLDPAATVGQVLAGEDFTDTLVTVFPMGEELEIPSHPTADESVEETKEEQQDQIQEEQDEEDEEENKEEEQQELLEGEQLEEEELVEEQQLDETVEAPHRKRFRRLNDYEEERLLIEREKLITLREIQRGIESKNEILRGILHVLQARLWPAHAGND